MTQHTPGPWWTDAKYDGQERGCAVIAARTDCGPLPGNPTRGMVAWATAILNTDARQCEANARLIACAPELLAAVEQAAAQCAECGGTGTYQYQFPLPDGAMAKPGESCAVCADLRALIARAKGEG